MKQTLIIVTVLSCSLFLCSRSEAGVGLDFRYCFVDFNSQIRADTAGTNGTNIELQNDLGVDDNEHLPEFDLYLSGRTHSLHLGYSWFEMKGESTVNQNIVFNGKTFPAATRVGTDIDTHWVKAFYGYNFHKSRTSFSTSLLGVQYFDIKTSIEGDGVGSTTEHIRAPVPSAGIKVYKSVFRSMEFRGYVTGFRWNLGDTDATLIDAWGGLAYNFNRSTALFGGYRFFMAEIEVNGSDNKIETMFRGPCVGISLRY